MDKLILKKKSSDDGFKSVMIHKDVYDKITEVKMECGLPFSSIISEMIDFAIDHLEIQE